MMSGEDSSLVMEDRGSNDEPKRLLRDTASDARAYQNRPKTGRPRTGTTRPLPKKFTRVYILRN